MKMIGKAKKTCRSHMHGSHVCDYCDVCNTKGKKTELRQAKRREKQALRRAGIE